ncbi:hypothetical protein ACVWXM_002558 [Bradyrhizobium sp. GM7.3]
MRRPYLRIVLQHSLSPTEGQFLTWVVCAHTAAVPFEPAFINSFEG